MGFKKINKIIPHQKFFQVIIEDVERLIIQRERKIASSGGTGASGAGGRFKDDPGGNPPINDPSGIDFYHCEGFYLFFIN